MVQRHSCGPCCPPAKNEPPGLPTDARFTRATECDCSANTVDSQAASIWDLRNCVANLFRDDDNAFSRAPSGLKPTHEKTKILDTVLNFKLVIRKNRIYGVTAE